MPTISVWLGSEQVFRYSTRGALFGMLFLAAIMAFMSLSLGGMVGFFTFSWAAGEVDGLVVAGGSSSNGSSS
eukprot:10026289-Heterocapsa_arctica.AAC.1